MRLLLVDDEIQLIRAVRRILLGGNLADLEITGATTSAEAILHLVDAPYDAVIADERLAGSSGSALLREVAVRWPATRRILWSGGRLPVEPRTWSSPHVVLQKPASQEDLEAAIAGPLPVLAAAGPRPSLVLGMPARARQGSGGSR